MSITTARSTQSSALHSGEASIRLKDPAYQAFWLLRIGFVVAPILFGLDKFAHVLVDWDKYLAPEFTDLFGAEAHTLMYGVGAIEIVAGLLVALMPRFGGYLVALTLARLATAFPARRRG